MNNIRITTDIDNTGIRTGMNGMKAVVDNATDSASKAFTSFKEKVGPIFTNIKNTAGKVMDQVEKSTKEATTAMSKSFKTMGDSVNKTLDTMKKAATTLKNVLSGPAGLVGGLLAGGAAVATLSKAIDNGSALYALNKATGMSIGSLEEFRAMLALTGGGVDELKEGVFTFTERMGEAARDLESEWAKRFKDMGIDASGSVDVAMKQMIKSLAKMVDEGKRSQAWWIGNDIFGGSWEKMSMMVTSGMKGYETAITKVKTLTIFDEGNVTRMQGFKESIDRIKNSILEFAVNISDEILPILGKLSNAFLGIFGIDLKSFGDAGTDIGKKFAESITAAMNTVFGPNGFAIRISKGFNLAKKVLKDLGGVLEKLFDSQKTLKTIDYIAENLTVRILKAFKIIKESLSTTFKEVAKTLPLGIQKDVFSNLGGILGGSVIKQQTIPVTLLRGKGDQTHISSKSYELLEQKGLIKGSTKQLIDRIIPQINMTDPLNVTIQNPKPIEHDIDIEKSAELLMNTHKQIKDKNSKRAKEIMSDLKKLVDLYREWEKSAKTLPDPISKDIKVREDKIKLMEKELGLSEKLKSNQDQLNEDNKNSEKFMAGILQRYNTGGGLFSGTPANPLSKEEVITKTPWVPEAKTIEMFSQAEASLIKLREEIKADLDRIDKINLIKSLSDIDVSKYSLGEKNKFKLGGMGDAISLTKPSPFETQKATGYEEPMSESNIGKFFKLTKEEEELMQRNIDSTKQALQAGFDLFTTYSNYKVQKANQEADLILEAEYKVLNGRMISTRLRKKEEEKLLAEDKKRREEGKKEAKAAQIAAVQMNTATSLGSMWASIFSVPKPMTAQLVLGGITSAMLLANSAIQTAAIAKFANGGIVPGNSYYGDRVPANVNSGEMILNANQQNELFRIANGKGNSKPSISVVINGNVDSDSRAKELESTLYNLYSNNRLEFIKG